MNKEELEKEAEEYKEGRRFKSINDDDDIAMSQNKWLETLKQAYLAGAEPREKRITELENVVLRLTNENKILKEGKTNVFAELNDETAKSNEMLMAKVADLEKKSTELKAGRPQ